MSVKYMGMVWELDLPHNELWTLMCLADHADHAGRNVFPSINLLVWKTGYSRSSIERLLRKFRNRNILQAYGKTRGGVKIYKIDFSSIPRKPEYEEPEIGRPLGSKIQKTPRQNDVGFDVHNRHSIFSNSTSTLVIAEDDSNSFLSSYSLSDFSDFSQPMTTRLTLSSVREFDPHPSGSGAQQRYCCPQCGLDKPRDEKHRSFALNIDTRAYMCHRCGLNGRLGQDSNESLPVTKAASQKPKSDWREVWERSRSMPLLGTAGEKYLKGRGIEPLLAAQSGVVFAGGLYNRAAVCFPIHDGANVLVAVQGRHIDKGEPRMHTIGPMKQGVFKTVGAFESNRLAVVEAPIDALSFTQMFQIPAIAVCGSGAMPDWAVKQFRGELLLASDNDAAGEKAAGIWARQAGSKIVTRRVCPNAKDWNADLLAGEAR